MKKNKSEEQLNNIGEYIYAARKRAGFSQAHLSALLELEALYICRGSISRIEHGQRAVTDIEITALAKLLKCTPNELFGWVEDTAQ